MIATKSYLSIYVMYRNAHVKNAYRKVNRYIANTRAPFELRILNEG